MFLIFKPPQSYLQVQLLDPDGFKKSFDELYEEQYAAAILKARQKRSKKRKKELELKKSIKQRLRGGQQIESVIADIALEESLRQSQQKIFDDLPKEMKVKIVAFDHAQQLMKAYGEQVRSDIAEMVAAIHKTIQDEIATIKRKQKEKRIKILLLFATMEEDE
jgi:IS30 family transposase